MALRGNRTRQWTVERNRELIRLWDEGRTIKYIAAALEVTATAVRNQAGVLRRRNPRLCPPRRPPTRKGAR